MVFVNFSYPLGRLVVVHRAALFCSVREAHTYPRRQYQQKA